MNRRGTLLSIVLSLSFVVSLDHKARRQLERLRSRGLAHRQEADPLPGSGARKAADRYFATTRIPEDGAEDAALLSEATDESEDAEDGVRQSRRSERGRAEDIPRTVTTEDVPHTPYRGGDGSWR